MMLSKYAYPLLLVLLGACVHQDATVSSKPRETSKPDPSIVGSLDNPKNLDSMNINAYKQWDRSGQMAWQRQHPYSVMKAGLYTPYDPYTPFPY